MVALSGQWTIKVVSVNAGWQQQIQISGSSGYDGVYLAVPGFTLPYVDGEMEITAQAYNPASGVWIDSLMQSTLAWSNTSGLEMQICVDDNPPDGDLDFNDVVLLCTTADPELTSPLAGPRPDLSIPERYYPR